MIKIVTKIRLELLRPLN